MSVWRAAWWACALLLALFVAAFLATDMTDPTLDPRPGHELVDECIRRAGEPVFAHDGSFLYCYGGH